jgi:hypothetical protein
MRNPTFTYIKSVGFFVPPSGTQNPTYNPVGENGKELRNNVKSGAIRNHRIAG